MLLGKDKLNDIAVLISKDLIHSYISHDEILSKNVMKWKKEIKTPEMYVECII